MSTVPSIFSKILRRLQPSEHEGISAGRGNIPINIGDIFSVH